MNTRQYFFVFIINKLLHNRRTSILTLCLSISSRRAFFSFLSFIEEKIETRALIVSQSFKNNINRKKKAPKDYLFFFTSICFYFSRQVKLMLLDDKKKEIIIRLRQFIFTVYLLLFIHGFIFSECRFFRLIKEKKTTKDRCFFFCRSFFFNL
jgi:hypothetical protein